MVGKTLIQISLIKSKMTGNTVLRVRVETPQWRSNMLFGANHFFPRFLSATFLVIIRARVLFRQPVQFTVGVTCANHTKKLHKLFIYWTRTTNVRTLAFKKKTYSLCCFLLSGFRNRTAANNHVRYHEVSLEDAQLHTARHKTADELPGSRTSAGSYVLNMTSSVALKYDLMLSLLQQLSRHVYSFFSIKNPEYSN